jgi:hypothetical protein
MKKIIALILCLVVVCVPIIASAEDGDIDSAVAGEVMEGDNSTPEDETPTEGENSGDEDYGVGDVFDGEVPDETPDETPEETPEETPPVIEPPVEETPEDDTDVSFKEEVEMVSEQIVKWLEDNSVLIGLIITIIGYGIVGFSKIKMILKSTGTINNNAITISKSNREALDQALAKMENASGVITGYDVRIATLLEAYKNTAEDKMRLERELMEIKDYIKTSSHSNLEFADELAELLALANIPNYKKEEIGARHLAAKKEILDAEAKAEAAVKSMMPTTTEEVKEDVGEEA